MAYEGHRLDVVTGAFGYTGRYIAQRLLAMGRRVRTLTGHPSREDSFRDGIESLPYCFEDFGALVKSLEATHTFYNTYWVRFPYGEATFERAVQNTILLIRAAREAGVAKFVHVSITNPSEDSPWPYFRCKAILERHLREAGLRYAILRPTVLFGTGDILVNNIAWLLRKFPVFAIAGSGDYRVQPVCAEDLADLAVEAAQDPADKTIDAVGPETFTFVEFVQMIAAALHRPARIVRVSPGILYALSRFLSRMTGDVVLTRDEIGGLMADLLISSRAPTGKTRFSRWLADNHAALGVYYASELARHYREARTELAWPSTCR